MRDALRAVARAVSSGRFVSRWTFVAIVAISLTIGTPLPAGLSDLERVCVAALTTAVFVVPWVMVAIVERRMPSARARAIPVAAVLVSTAVVRPSVQDAISAALSLPVPDPGAAVLRAGTNLAVWTIALIGTAALVDAARSTRETNILLGDVLAQWDAADERARAYAALARHALDDAAHTLETPRPATIAAVRELASDVRAHAHALAARADAPLEPVTEAETGARSAAERRSAASPAGIWRLPPVGLAAAVYAAAVMPYAVRSVSPADLVQGLLAGLACGVTGDLLARLPLLRRRRTATAVVFAAASLLTGAILTVIALAQGIPLAAALVSALVYPTLAVTLAAGRGARHVLRRERRRLSAAITARARADDVETRRFRAALHDASEHLHRDAQGGAMSFTLTHPDATPAQIEAFLTALRPLASSVREALDAPAAQSPLALDALLTTWGRAMPVQAHVGADADAALRADPALAREAIEVVAEGLLNAAKHARERRAEVDVRLIATAAGPRLRISVTSPGAPAAHAALRDGSRVAALGARLIAAPDASTLVAVFALSPVSVVSTEHLALDPTQPA